MAKSTTTPARHLLTINQAADLLGLAPRTIRRRIADGTLTGFRVLGTSAIRVDAAEVEGMLRVIPAVGGDYDHAA